MTDSITPTKVEDGYGADGTLRMDEAALLDIRDDIRALRIAVKDARRHGALTIMDGIRIGFGVTIASIIMGILAFMLFTMLGMGLLF